MKVTSFFLKKINKNITAARLMLLHWEKTYDLSLGMPFMGSNYLRKKRPESI